MTAPRIDDYLAHTPGATPNAKTIPSDVKNYLAVARTHLEQLHRCGAAGAQVNEAHSDLMDRLVRRLFELAEEIYFAGGEDDVAGLCVVAVGGYARREMNIYSDVDLLFLYREKISHHVSTVAERVQYWLWDASLAVGAATRTIRETIDLARSDMTVGTAVLAPRFLAGSGVLFHEFQDALRGELFSDPLKFIREQVSAQEERHTRFGDSLYLLQPNVKEGEGALRDYHLACWVMQVTQPRARGREDFLHLGLLTEEEMREFDVALDFFWRVRNELHLIIGRKNDQLGFDLQEKVALAFGFAKKEGKDLPVERFMSAYYRHARAIQNYSSLVVEQSTQRVSRPKRRKVERVAHGLRITEGHLEIPHARLLRENPLLLLTAFSVAQEHDVHLTRKARRLIREHLYLIDDDYRSSEAARKVFLRILETDKRVTRSLMVMNEIGLLGRFLPEWEHVVCRWQHVMYHTYTVDVHSIFLVEELRRLRLGKYDRAFPELTELMNSAEDVSVLYLGSLLHDIGKGFGDLDHSSRGVTRARPCLARLDLSEDKQERILFLVQHHLLMSHLAQRRDLSDPRLILEFAEVCRDRINLRNLYLLTFADMRASSATAWTSWKGRLLQELFEKTSELLETGEASADVAFALIEKRISTRFEAAAAELEALGVARSKIDAYFESMPRRYFAGHSPRQIARHARVVLGLGDEKLLAMATREFRGDFTEFILCTRDVHGLYANVAGVLTANGIDILGAHIYSTRNGLALEVYRVSTPPGGEEERRLAWEKLENELEKVLKGDIDVKELMSRRGRVFGTTAPPSPRPAIVSITNDESDFYTIVDVSANDRLGLLHDLTRVIADNGCEIYISKAALILDQVADTFYLKDAEGKKLKDAGLIERIRKQLLEVAGGEEAGDDG